MRVRPSELRGGGLRQGVRGLGAVNTAGLVSTGVGIGVTAGVTAASSAGIIAVGSAAGPIGAAAAAVVALIMSLWSAHAARAKGAQTENAAMNSAVVAFDGSLKAIFAAANAGTISASDAASYCQQNMQAYWTGMAPYMTGPGRADGSHGGTGCTSVIVCNQQTSPGLACNKSCTAGCCVGCDVLTPTINQAIAIFEAGGGTLNVCPVYGSGYGGQSRASYSLTYTAPTVAQTAASATQAASTAVSSTEAALGVPSTVAGIPTWLLAVGGLVGLFLVVR
jgi:hypothetical protein